ncbi:MAG: hypothetical protein O7G85_05155 [Planctomycetota bacterium]|nr:hypothetical protein [Planctomycetota bacterium]
MSHNPKKHDECDTAQWIVWSGNFVQLFVVKNRRPKWREVVKKRGRKGLAHMDKLQWHVDDEMGKFVRTVDEPALIDQFRNDRVLLFDFYDDPYFLSIEEALSTGFGTSYLALIDGGNRAIMFPENGGFMVFETRNKLKY